MIGCVSLFARYGPVSFASVSDCISEIRLVCFSTEGCTIRAHAAITPSVERLVQDKGR
jgi:hypothetical protein